MRVLLKKRVGDLELEIEAEGRDEKDIFPQLEFWSSLPSAHPSGATDFQIAARPATTKENRAVTYYEIICKSVGERFCFGQATEQKGGGLFPKGWQPVYHGDGDGGDYHNQPETPAQRESRPAQPAQRPTQATTSNQELDKAITGHFKRLGINNPGQEKGAVMKALNSRVGQLVVELALTEKQDLLAWLEQQEIGRAA